MITASTLTYRVGIYKPVTVRDTFGAQATVFEYVRDVWADVKYKKGSRAAALCFIYTLNLKLIFAPAAARITTKIITSTTAISAIISMALA